MATRSQYGHFVEARLVALHAVQVARLTAQRRAVKFDVLVAAVLLVRETEKLGLVAHVIEEVLGLMLSLPLFVDDDQLVPLGRDVLRPRVQAAQEEVLDEQERYENDHVPAVGQRELHDLHVAVRIPLKVAVRRGRVEDEARLAKPGALEQREERAAIRKENLRWVVDLENGEDDAAEDRVDE